MEFKKYCEENPDATVEYRPSINGNYVSDSSFQEVIEPIVKEFVRKMMSALSEYNTTFNQPQLKYITDTIKNRLMGLRYDPRNDLKKAMQTIFTNKIVAHNNASTPFPAKK